jgi:hypothetical protein
MTISFTKISHSQGFKIAKAFFYVAISFLLSVIPAYFAHNPAYVALTVPINVALVAIKQIITNDEQNALAALPASQAAGVTTVATQVEQIVTPTSLTPPTNPTPGV